MKETKKSLKTYFIIIGFLGLLGALISIFKGNSFYSINFFIFYC